jgi:ABC-2 type transport system permease protein
MGGMGSLITNANLIQKVYFPRVTLVISSALALLFTFSIEMAVLVLALVLFGGNPLPYLPVTIFFMLALLCFGLGISLLLSIANVYFRDTQHFISIITQVWFYATPIIYPLSLIADKYPGVIRFARLNPIERFAEVFRSTLYDAKLPTLLNTAYVLAWSVGALALGYLVFRHYEGRLAEEL